MTEFEYTLYGQPMAWTRPRSNGRRHFTPQRVLDEQERHRATIELCRPEGWALGGRFAVHVKAFVDTFKNGAPKLVDVDNLAKLVLDGIQGVAFENDKLVERLVVERRVDHEDPRTEVRVIRIEETAA